MDSEGKAAARALRGLLQPLIRRENVVLDRPGRGGNFAAGYQSATHSTSSSFQPPLVTGAFTLHQPVHGPICGSDNTTPEPSLHVIEADPPRAHVAPAAVSKATLRSREVYSDKDEQTLLMRAVAAVTQEASRCPGLTSLVVMHSLAGGTGSGLTAALVRELRKIWSTHYIISICVLPMDGETALQSYNTVLALSHIHDHVDCIITLDNEQVLRTLMERQSSVSLHDINVHSAISLAAVLVPGPLCGRSQLWQLCSALCAAPGCKMLGMRSAVLAKDTSKGAADCLAAMLATWSQRCSDGSKVSMRMDGVLHA